MQYPCIVIDEEVGTPEKRRVTDSRTLPVRVLRGEKDRYGLPLSWALTEPVYVASAVMKEIISWWNNPFCSEPDLSLHDREYGFMIIRGSYRNTFPRIVLQYPMDGGINLKVQSHRNGDGALDLASRALREDLSLKIEQDTVRNIIDLLHWNGKDTIVIGTNFQAISVVE